MPRADLRIGNNAHVGADAGQHDVIATAPSALAAVAFDMDGLLIDSEPLWTVAETELAASLGETWTQDIKARCIGKRMDQAVPIMLSGLQQPVTPGNVEATSGFLLRRMVELFAEELPIMPGATALMADLTSAKLPCVLVSSSFRVLVDACLAGLGEHPFVHSIAGDEVEHPKPHPEPYLRAAEALNVAPRHCVVLEDSGTGATSGVAAGCVTVLVPGDTVPPPVRRGGWTVVSSLTDVTLESLRSLIR